VLRMRVCLHFRLHLHVPGLRRPRLLPTQVTI